MSYMMRRHVRCWSDIAIVNRAASVLNSGMMKGERCSKLRCKHWTLELAWQAWRVACGVWRVACGV